MPMYVCHVIKGRPWQFDKGVVHDGRINIYTFEKDGGNHTLITLKFESAIVEISNQVFMMNE